MYDVITIGAATRDVFLRSTAWEVKEDAHSPTGLEQCLPLGSKISVDDLVVTTGGGATNVAVTFARLGKLHTACVARIGSDADGNEILRELRTERVATAFLQRDPKRHTAYSTILLSGTGERTVLVHRGASTTIAPHAIPWTKVRSRWYYVTSLAGDLALIKKILVHAEHIGAHVAWNPGNAELGHGWNALAPLIARTMVFDVNREEATLLTGKHPDALVDMLRALNAPSRITLITDGSRGAHATDGTTTWHIASRDVPATNTTGAGDAFGSGFVTGLIRGMDIPTALRLAMANAEGVITHMGAKTGILSHVPSARVLAQYRIQSV